MSCAKNLAATTFNIHFQPLIEENLHNADASESPDFDITFLHAIKLIDDVRVFYFFCFVQLGLYAQISGL
jgi:hypothetical protein